MITVPLIPWQPIAAMPEDRKDGRDLLLAVANLDRTTLDGEDRLHSTFPFRYYIGSWAMGEGRWRTTESVHEGEIVCLELDEPCSWADINPPG